MFAGSIEVIIMQNFFPLDRTEDPDLFLLTKILFLFLHQHHHTHTAPTQILIIHFTSYVVAKPVVDTEVNWKMDKKIVMTEVVTIQAWLLCKTYRSRKLINNNEVNLDAGNERTKHSNVN